MIVSITDVKMRLLGADPSEWPTYRFPYTWQTIHQKESPMTPFSIAEFQGGSGEGWYVVLIPNISTCRTTLISD